MLPIGVRKCLSVFMEHQANGMTHSGNGYLYFGTVEIFLDLLQLLFNRFPLLAQLDHASEGRLQSVSNLCILRRHLLDDR